MSVFVFMIFCVIDANIVYLQYSLHQNNGEQLENKVNQPLTSSFSCSLLIYTGSSVYDHSKYCDVIVEQLIRPIAEAGLTLEGESQRVYMNLAISILFNEYRKVILHNKHTYRYI